jgi:hypothetical protein
VCVCVFSPGVKQVQNDGNSSESEDGAFLLVPSSRASVRHNPITLSESCPAGRLSPLHAEI